jgi:hypothetical protein
MAFAGVIVYEADHEVQLDVGPRQARFGPHEAAGLGEVSRKQARAIAPPAHDLARQPGQAAQREAEEVRALRLVKERKIDVVLQILTHTR